MGLLCGACGRMRRGRAGAWEHGAGDKRSDGNLLNRAGVRIQKLSSAFVVRFALTPRSANTEQYVLMRRQQIANLNTLSDFGQHGCLKLIANPPAPAHEWLSKVNII